MFGLLNSVLNLGKNVVDIAVAPVEVAVDIVNAGVKPVADAAKDIVKDIKESTK